MANQQIRRGRLSAVALLSLLIAVSVSADSSLKRKVFENCSAVKEGAVKLAGEERREFIDYLGRVVTLRIGDDVVLADPSQSTPVPRGFETAFGAGSNLELWRTFQPNREEQAKRCAIELITLLLPESSVTLNQLVDLIDEPRISDELRDSADQATWNILRSLTSSPQFELPHGVVEGLVGNLGKKTENYLTDNVIVELNRSTLPLLLAAMKSPDISVRDRAAQLLLRIDPPGGTVIPAILPLLESGDDQLRLKVVKILERFPRLATVILPALFGRLTDPSPEVCSATLRSISKLSRANPGLVLERSQQQQLLELFQRGDETRRNGLQPLLVAQLGSSAQFDEDLLSLLNQGVEAGLQRRVITLISGVTALYDRAYPRFVDLLYGDNVELKLAALSGMSQIEGRQSETMSSLLSVLKSSGISKDRVLRDRFLLATVDALSSFTHAKDLERFLPYLIDAMALPSISSGEEKDEELLDIRINKVLAQIGRNAISHLTKSLSSPVPLVRARAISGLMTLAVTDRKTAKLVIDLLKDKDSKVRRQALLYLERVNADEQRRDLVRLLDSKDQIQRSAAALALINTGSVDSSLKVQLLENFKQADCLEQITFAPIAFKTNVEWRTPIAEALLGCLERRNAKLDSVLAALDQLAPFDAGVGARVMALVSAQENSHKLQLIDRLARYGVPAETRQRSMVEVTKGADNSTKIKVLTALAEEQELSEDTVDLVEGSFLDDDNESILRNAALVVLVKHNLRPDDTKEYLVKELKSNRHRWVQDTLNMLPPAILSAMIKELIEQVPADRRYLLAQLIGEHPELSSEFVPLLFSKLANSTAEFRFYAVEAILKLAPAREEIEELVRRELVGPYGYRFLDSNLPDGCRDLLKRIEGSPRSVVEQKLAQQLLQKLDAPLEKEGETSAQ